MKRLRYEEFEDAPGSVVLDGNLDRDEDNEFQIEFRGDLDDLEALLERAFGKLEQS